MPEHSRFQRAREKIALKWARRALAALAALTSDQDSPDRRWDGVAGRMVNIPTTERHHPPFVRESVSYVPAIRESVLTPLFRAELTNAQSLRTLYPQLAEHPSLSRARAEVQTALRAEAWRDLDGAMRASANLARKRRQYPAAYVVEPFTERDHGALSDRPMMSTTYVKVVSWIADGWIPRREVSWIVADDPMPNALARGIPTRAAMALERSADAFLRENDPCVGQHDDAAEDHRVATLTAVLAGRPDEVPNRPRLIRLDMIDRWSRQPLVAPDPSGYRGVVRKRVPSPVRYVSKPADGDADSVWSTSIGIIPRTLTEYRVDRVGSVSTEHYVTHADGSVCADVRAIDPSLGAYRPKLLTLTSEHRFDFAWIGHWKIATGAKVRATRKAAKRKSESKLKRGDAIGTRGKPRNGWTLSDRSLWRAWSKADAGQHATASLLVSLLTKFDRGIVVEIGEHFRCQTDTATVVRIDDHGRPSRSFTHQAFARRAALAREDVA